MSIKFKVPLNLVGLANDPGSAVNGDLYFNTTSNKVRYYTNSAWQDLGAAAGGASVQVSTTIPTIATEGKLWYDNDDARLYVYDGTYWVEVSIGPVGPAGPTGTTGPGVATAGTTGQYLVKSSNNNYETTWSTLPAASLTSTDVSRLTGATSNLQTQINTLSTNLGNTLDDYVPIGDVGVADGVASLDSAGKIPIAQLGNLIDGAPGALDTLNELAAAINDDASYAAGITTALGTKISNAGGDIITSSLASTIPLRIRGAASQTANLQQWQNSSGTVLASIASNGAIQAGTYNGVVINLNYPGIVIDTSIADSTQVWLRNLSATSKSGRFVGIKARNGYANAVAGDDLVTLAGEQYINSLNYESAKILISNDNSTPSTTSYPARITFHTTAIDSTTLTERMRISSSGNVLVNGFTASTVGLSVKGAASQTANLQEWQNSSNTVLAKITASGALDVTAITVNGAALNTLPSQTGNSGKYLTTDGNNASWGSINSNIIRRKSITATAGQTVFTTDLPFIDGLEQVFFNGLLLLKTSDYTTSGGNTVTLTSAAAVSDIVEIISVTEDNSVNTYTQAEVDALLAANTSVAPISISTNTNLAAKKRYFVTSASALTLTLPATPALNDEVQIVDASGNALTYNITVARNGKLINGNAGNIIIDVNGGWYTLVFTGNAYGWKVG
jgi:hypothetical protein